MEIGVSRSTVRSWSRARNSLPARLPFAVRVKKRNCFGPGDSAGRGGCRLRDPHDLLHALATGRAGAHEDQLADQLGLVLSDHLGDHAAQRESVKIDLVDTQNA